MVRPSQPLRRQDGKGLRPNTARNYEGLIKYHVKPRIGHIPLQKLTPEHLQQLYRAMLEEKGPKDRCGRT